LIQRGAGDRPHPRAARLRQRLGLLLAPGNAGLAGARIEPPVVDVGDEAEAQRGVAVVED